VSGKTVFDAIKELNTVFSDPTTGFYKQYSDVCSDNLIVKEALACSNPGTDLNASKFIVNDS
jgi:hypothetical protein